MHSALSGVQVLVTRTPELAHCLANFRKKNTGILGKVKRFMLCAINDQFCSILNRISTALVTQ
jgi:hypothetical protein